MTYTLFMTDCAPPPPPLHERWWFILGVYVLVCIGVALMRYLS